MDFAEVVGKMRDWFGSVGETLSYAFGKWRPWFIAGFVVIFAGLVIWARMGFMFEVSRFFAQTPPTTTTTDPNCGPSIPENGRFEWEYAADWPDCSESGSRFSPQDEFFAGADVGACHPDGLHLVWRGIFRPKATCSFEDTAGVELSEGQGIRTEHSNPRVINNDWPDDEGGRAVMFYDANAANCGSVHLFGAFWADGLPGVYKHNNAGNTGWHVVLNYGRDCSGATGEKTPGGVGGTGGGGGGSCPQHPGGARPATVTAACQEGTIRVSWQNPLELNAAVNSLLRNVNGDNGRFIFEEGGCWNTFGIGNAVDADIQPGNTYSYRVKTDAAVVSNTVSIKVNEDGTCQPVETVVPPPPTTSPVPTPTLTPFPSIPASPTATPRPTVAVTATPRPTQTPGFVSVTPPPGGGVGTAGQTPTGPGGATLVAFVLASLTALLYVSYTHTDRSRRREVRRFEHDSMDFRN
ncbi:MAG TPA: hypothetical protein VD862_02915 [Candidatus Paceibacterota bacterium]|nr:hypothetical protein [Candidatus Paceibacterota bacterium]